MQNFTPRESRNAMTQENRRGVFASLFGSRKKHEEELEAEKEYRERLEVRIQEALVLLDPPKIEPAFECERLVGISTEIQPMTSLAPIPSEPEEVIDYSYLRPITGPESSRRHGSPSRYRPFQTLEPAAASRAR